MWHYPGCFCDHSLGCSDSVLWQHSSCAGGAGPMHKDWPCSGTVFQPEQHHFTSLMHVVYSGRPAKMTVAPCTCYADVAACYFGSQCCPLDFRNSTSAITSRTALCQSYLSRLFG